MEKTIKLFWLLALIAFLFSCGKENSPVDETPEVPDSEISNLDPSVYLLGFGASVEALTTKADVDLTEGTIVFEENADEVLVYVPATGATGVYAYKASNDRFEPKTDSDAVSLGDNYALAYYPAEEFSVSSGTVTFTLPSTAGNLIPMSGIIPGLDANNYPQVSFKHLGSVLCCHFNSAKADGETITSATLTVAGANITGSGTVAWTENTAAGYPTLSALSGGTEVTINEKTHLKSSDYATFYFFLPAGVTLSSLTVKATYGKDIDGDETVDFAPYVTISRNSGFTTVRKELNKVEKSLASFFGGGDGSAEHPYLIGTADEFKAIATLANAKAAGVASGNLHYDYNGTRTFFGSAGVHYKQTANIDFENANITSSMIGSDANPFAGTYDGDGKSLSNFSIEASGQDNVGLFRAISTGAVLHKIVIPNGGAVSGKANVGGLVGKMIDGKVYECCKRTGNVSGTGNSVGGLVGDMKGGTLTANYTHSSVKVTGNQNVGGIIGYMDGQNGRSCLLINSAAKAKVQANNNHVGGLVGLVESTSPNTSVIANSVGLATQVWMNISNDSGRAGGIAGYMDDGEKTGNIIHNCYTQANNTNFIGRFDGDTPGTIQPITCSGWSGSGGIFGVIKCGSVYNCYYTRQNSDAAKTPGPGRLAQSSTADVTTQKVIYNSVKNGQTDGNYGITASFTFHNGRANKNCTLVEALNIGRYATSSGDAIQSYTSSAGTEEFCEWTTKGSTHQAYPKALNDLGDDYHD